MAGNFKRDLTTGEKAELFFEKYCKTQNISYQDVRMDKEYQKADIDYITDKLGKVEVKCNYKDAMYGRPGRYFLIELYQGEKDGWWHYSKPDWFCFNDTENSGILIENSPSFRKFINNCIESGDHSKYGNNRIDKIKDKRPYGYITMTCMRVYISDMIDSGLPLVNIVTRRKI